MKSLLIATDSFLPRWDGVARFLSEIIPRLKKYYKITVICPDFKGKKIRIKGVEIIRIPLQKITIGDYTPSVLDIKRIKKIVMKQDVIFTQSIGPIGGPAIYYGQKFKKKVVGYMHSLEWELVSQSIKKYKKSTHAFVRKYAKYLYNKCNVIIVPSSHIRHELEKLGVKTKKMIVHVGTDSDYFKPGLKSRVKKSLGIKGDTLVVGFLGRIAREKNLITLERAFFKIHNRYPDLKLMIVGTGVREEIDRLKRKGVILKGSQDHVVPFYQAMDIYVLPSLTETSSISTMEAMSCGLPVIVTSVGFLKGYIREGENGMFIQRGNVDQLAKKLELLILDEKLRKKLGKEARDTIIERFDWKRTVKKLRKVLG
tara:strand:- start:799 stop:1905 length:1107 start_codon:yes stop_codon:yes gene_type:complete